MGHGIIAWIVIGIIAGWLTGKLMKGSGFGVIVDIIVGLVGATIGGFLSSHLGLSGVGDHGLIASIVIAVIGAVILTFLLRLITGNRSANHLNLRERLPNPRLRHLACCPARFASEN
jgi:uncharacterized membrane protein YeaQ/YmgE (transglycosylase-associated protein family)